MVNYKKLGKLLIWRCKQKKVGSQLPTATMAEIEETETVPSILLPCTSCNRTFRPEALAKHAKVCEKILMKKRKQFDSSKQRLQGTEIENFSLQPAPKQTRKKESQLNLSKSKWKEKVEHVRTMQAMKKQAESPLSAQVKPSDHEECSYCGRSFGPKAYERHTEFCKEQHHKLKLSNSGNNEALERLKVRTMYRGPLTNKVLNRDRYQPNRNRDPSPLGTSYSESLDDVNKSRGLMRNSSLRSSLRSKPETTPPPPLRRTMTQINPPSGTRAPRGSTKDLNETDLLQKTPTLNNKPRLISKESNQKRDAEKYNPYLSAERQMLELFGADDGKAKTTLPDIHHSSPLQSSPVSAFVKYSSPKRASSIESLKYDNKENNNVNPEINDFPPVEEKMDNRKHFSLSNLSLCSVVSIDSIDCNKNAFNTKLANSHLDDFQRSFSAIESKSNRAYVKPKVNLQQMLYGLPSPEQTEQTTSSESSNSDTGNLEACEAELLISMLEFEKMLKSSPPSSPETSPNLCSSSEQKRKETKDDAEENRNQKHLNNSIDSAYSSLTRSSGADGETGNLEMSKFCHECGVKYPIAGAKFCCNCGMRRITL